MQHKWWGTLLVSLVLALASPALADGHGGDSSADVDGGFHAVVSQADAVMIRVPIDKDGREDGRAAQVRVYESSSTARPTDLKAAWDRAIDGTQAPVINTAPAAGTDGSSSTNWCGWYPYQYNGWYPSYYYYSYQPSYYYYGNYWRFGNPSYWNYYTYGYPYYGYRYYYYSRWW